MKRSGMTILELLLALALLGALSALLTSWVVTISRLSSEHGPRVEWRSAAERVMGVIEDDLACGDFQMQDRKTSKKSRIEVLEPSRLRIATRTTSEGISAPAGPATHEFRFDRSSGMLRLSVASGTQSGSTTARPLLNDVADWSVELNEKERILSVTIQSQSGDKITRSFTWP